MNWIKINKVNINLDNIVSIITDTHLRRLEGENTIIFKEVSGNSTSVGFENREERDEVYERILKSLYV